MADRPPPLYMGNNPNPEEPPKQIEFPSSISPSRAEELRREASQTL